ncbi:MAG: hypothetical protein U0746_02850 [Gemmataceae bacterium]
MRWFFAFSALLISANSSPNMGMGRGKRFLPELVGTHLAGFPAVANRNHSQAVAGWLNVHPRPETSCVVGEAMPTVRATGAPAVERFAGLTILHEEIDTSADIDPGQEFDHREQFDQAHADGLGEEIAGPIGQLEEIKIVRRPGRKDAIADGRHRFFGARKFGVKTLRAAVLVGEITDKNLYLFGLVVNLRRKNLSAYELGMAALTMKRDHEMTEAEIGAVLGNKSQGYINRLVNNLRLPQRTLELYREGRIDASAVGKLRKAPRDQIDALADRVVAGEFKNRDALAAAVEALRPSKPKGRKPIKITERNDGVSCSVSLPPGLAHEVAATKLAATFKKLLQRFAEGKKLPESVWAKLFSDN